MIEFIAHDRRVRLVLDLPDREDEKYVRIPGTRRRRSPTAAEERYSQDVRQRWRALALVVKAKLEAVSTGIVSFEDEWASYVVLPDGSTVAEHVQPAIDQAYETGKCPRCCPAMACGRYRRTTQETNRERRTAPAGTTRPAPRSNG